MPNARQLVVPVMLVLLCSAPGALAAAGADANGRPLMGTHSLELGLGFLGGVKSESSVSAAGVSTNTGASGVLGSLTYLYGLDQMMQLSVGSSVLGLDTSTSTGVSGSTSETGMVVALLFGGRYVLPALDERGVLRAHVDVAFGPYVGSANNVQAGLTTGAETITETTFGSRIGIGLNARTGRHFSIGVGAAYHFMGDFERWIGAKRNYSGPEAGLALAFIFGGG